MRSRSTRPSSPTAPSRSSASTTRTRATGRPAATAESTWGTNHVFTVSGVLSALSSTSVGVEVDGHPEPVRCAVPASVKLSGFAVGQDVEMSCRFADSRFVLVKLSPKTADSPGDGGGSVDVQGSITELNPTAVTVAVPPPPGVASVYHESQSVMCVLQAGEDLRGFAVGDFVEIQ